ncbi:MAG: large conductance mechanosensitive channel protein MscL [Micrococcales bacterium]|nr:MAG: large conductance mechanosensitive channel protein MscL [Micrococcales bacterium]
MLKGFKDFVMRGNVMDLAVGVAIATAFTALIDAFTAHIINPILAAVGGADTGGWGIQLREANEATLVDFGSLIGALIQFLITAAVIYFVLVAPMNKFNEMRGAKDEEEDAVDEVAVLTEIRDLLKTRA